MRRDRATPWLIVFGLALIGGCADQVTAQGQPATAPPPRAAKDAVDEAQTPREVAKTRPEQQQLSDHDRSFVFNATNAKPASPVFDTQPEKGKIAGFDFVRDPLNAKQPMQA